ncbi:MAG: antitoxin [Faecalimonas sp.]|nr:antitoxin [Faecalimonas sp.]
MREFDEYGLKLCRYQAVVFQMSNKKTECSSPIFLRRFMYSDVAQRMDRESFLYEALPQEAVIDEITIEFGKSHYGKVKYGEEELYWMGYLYRYWCYTHRISSKRLYKMLKPEELKKLYYPYHSLDPAQAIERIKEANGWEEEDDIQKGVKLMREWMKKQ